MHKVAIIGYLGSGKSEILGICSDLDFPTVSADHIAKMLLSMPGVAHDDVIKAFPGVADSARKIDRHALAEIVFSDPEKLAMLESLVHPHVWQIVASFFMECEKKKEEICFVEVSAPDETIKQRFNEMWLVDADISLRHDRCVQRGMTSEDFHARNDYQQVHIDLHEIATRKIVNDGNKDKLIDVIKTMCNELSEKRNL